ncbi:MAG: acyl-CoA dehydrogenase family protein, partial [Panacagrimonas sp.]
MILSDEQRALRETARRFAEKKLLPDYQKRERSERLDRDLVREMGELGLIAPDMPEQFGGLGASGLTTGIVIEQIGWGDINVSYVPLMASLTGK